MVLSRMREDEEVRRRWRLRRMCLNERKTHAMIVGGSAWCCRRYRTAAVAASENESACVNAALVRRGTHHAWRGGGLEPLRHALDVPRFCWAGKPARVPRRVPSRSHSSRRAAKARHDSRRPVQHQRGHRQDSVRGSCGGVSSRTRLHHLQSRELHRSHRRRGAQEGWRVRQAPRAWRHHTGRRALQSLRV